MSRPPRPPCVCDQAPCGGRGAAVWRRRAGGRLRLGDRDSRLPTRRRDGAGPRHGGEAGPAGAAACAGSGCTDPDGAVRAEGGARRGPAVIHIAVIHTWSTRCSRRATGCCGHPADHRVWTLQLSRHSGQRLAVYLGNSLPNQQKWCGRLQVRPSRRDRGAGPAGFPRLGEGRGLPGSPADAAARGAAAVTVSAARRRARRVVGAETTARWQSGRPLGAGRRSIRALRECRDGPYCEAKQGRLRHNKVENPSRAGRAGLRECRDGPPGGDLCAAALSARTGSTVEVRHLALCVDRGRRQQAVGR